MCSSNISAHYDRMILCFDLDGTICSSVDNSQYSIAEPDDVVINEINRLYDLGNIIKIMTARGSVSGIDYTQLTIEQLNGWGLKYHELIMNKKPHADLFIDDRAINIKDWKENIPFKYGILAGAFDIIHPGYIEMFKKAKLSCNHLTVALHEDPSLENNKVIPVHSVYERKNILLSIKYIDDVFIYKTENDLYKILSSGGFDIRFLGEDYLDKDFTGKDLDIPIYWIKRNHNYSTSDLKRKIAESWSVYENK